MAYCIDTYLKSYLVFEFLPLRLSSFLLLFGNPIPVLPVILNEHSRLPFLSHPLATLFLKETFLGIVTLEPSSMSEAVVRLRRASGRRDCRLPPRAQSLEMVLERCLAWRCVN